MGKIGLAILLLTLTLSAQALDLNDALRGILKSPTATSPDPSVGPNPVNTARVGDLKTSEVNSGLKEALVRGSEMAVAQLGQKDGFYGNPALKITLPASLQKAEKAMRMLGMGQQADDLVLAMNRAAEAAVPEAKSLLVGAVRSMSVEDAKGILLGGNTAATDFFRKKTESTLVTRFLPIVKTTTDQSSLAQQYNTYAGMAAQFNLGKKAPLTVEDYVTRQALDRLYQVIGEQERAIRANPVQAGSALIKKVFGAVTGN
ncbi:MAG: DUF4197 domain-containing protein [Thiobacillus sp.]